MPVTVPYEVITTGDQTLDRIQSNVSQAVRQLQDQIQPQSSVTIRASFTLARQTSVFVSSEATSSIVVTLPNRPPGQQTTRIVNGSAYAVKVRTADSNTVFGDIQPGASLTVYGTGQKWTA